MVAFGPADLVAPGYPAAVAACRAGGFAPIARLAGGRAAIFHERTLGFAWAIPDPAPIDGIHARFRAIAEIVAAAFQRLGVDARIGEVPGEYCPGAYSVNAGGRVKLMGAGQRITGGAAHVGGVIVVGDSRRIRDVLVPVYAALGLDWDPATTGSLEDEVGPVDLDAVAGVVLDEFARRHDLMPGTISDEVLAGAAAETND